MYNQPSQPRQENPNDVRPVYLFSESDDLEIEPMLLPPRLFVGDKAGRAYYTKLHLN